MNTTPGGGLVPEDAPIRARLAEHTTIALLTSAVISVAVSVFSLLFGTYAYVAAPIVGVLTLAYSILVKSPGGGLLGVFEILMPIGLFIVASYMVSVGL